MSDAKPFRCTRQDEWIKKSRIQEKDNADNKLQDQSGERPTERSLPCIEMIQRGHEAHSVLTRHERARRLGSNRSEQKTTYAQGDEDQQKESKRDSTHHRFIVDSVDSGGKTRALRFGSTRMPHLIVFHNDQFYSS